MKQFKLMDRVSVNGSVGRISSICQDSLGAAIYTVTLDNPDTPSGFYLARDVELRHV